MANISQEIMDSFISETEELLDEIRKNVLSSKTNPDNDEHLASLLRDLHTIKGNSRMLGHKPVEKLAHAVEDIYKSVKDGKIKNTDRLVRIVFFVSDKMKECLRAIRKNDGEPRGVDLYLRYCDKISSGDFIDIETFSREIQKERAETILGHDEDDDEPIYDIQSVRINLSRINELISSFDTLITREFRLKHQLDELEKIQEATGNHALAKIRKQFEEDIFALETALFGVQGQVFDLRMLPIKIVLKSFESAIPVEAMQLGKKVTAHIPDTQIAIDKFILEKLNDILTHLVRNAIDHGIESPEERIENGKDETGTVSITCVRETKHALITVSDDGRGLDYEKIREKALHLYPERADEISGMGNRELSQFLFRSGFSTKDSVTAAWGLMLSGRMLRKSRDE